VIPTHHITDMCWRPCCGTPSLTSAAGLRRTWDGTFCIFGRYSFLGYKKRIATHETGSMEQHMGFPTPDSWAFEPDLLFSFFLLDCFCF
jgi:hypothetical protein